MNFLANPTLTTTVAINIYLSTYIVPGTVLKYFVYNSSSNPHSSSILLYPFYRGEAKRGYIISPGDTSTMRMRAKYFWIPGKRS